MTKKHIWAKLLVVALIVAMVCAFFIACDKECTSHIDKDGNGKCDNCGADMPKKEPEVDTSAIDALLGVVDDAIAQLKIDNVGNIGTDAFIELAMAQGDKTNKIRIDLDLSLDLLKASESVYANNGFGFTVSVNDKREFGLWYVDAGAEDTEGNPIDNYFYLTAGGKNLKIDALALSSVLSRYGVNADVEVGSKLEGFSVTEAASGMVSMIAGFVTVNHETKGNQEIFSLNVRELFNPTGMLCGMIDGLLFDEATIGFDLAGILKDMNIAISSAGDLYDVIPDVNLQVIGNYDASENFESIGLGLAVGEKADGITIPTVDEKGMTIVETVPATNLSASLGYKFFTDGYEAYDNVLASQNAVIDEIGAKNWNNIGLLNFALDAQVTVGKTAEDAKTYNVELSADVNLAAVADATFVKKLYYTENGVATSKDWFYLRGVGPFKADTELDVIDTLLPAINSLYIKMVNVKDPSDILLINLDEAITMEGLDFKTGKITVSLKALTGILDTFGIKLDSTISGMIEKIDNKTLVIGDFLGAVKPVLAGFIYKSVPADATTTAPEVATADETATDGEDKEEVDIMGIIKEVIEKVKGAIKDRTEDSINVAGSGADYAIGDATLSFDMTASLLKNAEKAVNGVKVVFNAPFVSDYNAEIKEGEGENAVVIGTDKVKTTVNVPYLQIGGTGNLFSATVSVTQEKNKTYTNPDENHKNEASTFSIYIGIDLEKIGYGCATTAPVTLDGDKNPTSSIFTNAGWSISKAEIK